jgi:RHS repeat-associated protein
VVYNRQLTLALAASISLLTAAATVRADPTVPSSDEPTGVFGEGGSGADADAKTGSMKYSYSFKVPAARGRPQPRLSLNYSSATRDREAGYGWGLNLPVIERRAMAGPIRFIDTPSDRRFYFNGAPLILVCRVPSAECGTDPMPNWPDWAAATGYEYYRMQIEGMFARFFLAPDGRSWRVQLRDGQLMEFGDANGVKATEENRWPTNGVVRWRLNRQSDAQHPLNYVQYKWRELGARGLLFVTDIYDTAKALNASPSEFAHHTQLSWMAPDYASTAYADRDRAAPDVVLSRVAVASATWSGSGPREVIRVYRLLYAATRGTGTFDSLADAPLWHHAFLKQIQMEGKCAQLEDASGNIPADRECVAMPPVTFEYEGGPLASSIAFLSTTNGATTLVDENRVFDDLDSVSLIDFNRDGLPDVVQSWESRPSCGPSNAQVDVTGVAVGCNGRAVGFTRPIAGYLNRGLELGYAATLKLSFDHQCMDGGFHYIPPEQNMPGGTFGDDGLSPAHFNKGKISGFLGAQGAASLVGGWSYGLVAWGNAGYAPFFAQPIIAYANLLVGAGSGCDRGFADKKVGLVVIPKIIPRFDESQFNPGWRWLRTAHEIDWAKPMSGFDGTPQVGPGGWFADIDGDGLLDRLEEAANAPGDLQPARVNFTLRYQKGQTRPAPGPGASIGAVQVPFETDQLDGSARSLVPSRGARSDTKFFYVDVNGDGLVDLVMTNPADDGGAPRVLPGDGKGHFGCDNSKQVWTCSADGSYSLVNGSASTPWPFDNETYIHDLTGDGLPDIIKWDPVSGKVRLWVNQDGHTFACAGIDTPDSCDAGYVFDDKNATFDVGPHRVTFADMNGDGVDDFVVIGHQGVFFLRMTAFTGRRPGLLTAVDNGLGARTEIEYATIQQLDLAAERAGKPWLYHSPAVESVVTRINTRPSLSTGTLNPPFAFNRQIEYTYRDPAYDRWSRAFNGFRSVTVHSGTDSAVTRTFYWFGPCQNDSFFGGPMDQPGDPAVRCPGGSDDEAQGAATGRAVRIDRMVPEIAAGATPSTSRQLRQEERYLWSQVFGFATTDNGFIATSAGARQIRYSPTTDVTTYVYDAALPTSADMNVTRPVAGGDWLVPPPLQTARRKFHKHIEYDAHGIAFRIQEDGLVESPKVTPNVPSLEVYSANDPDIEPLATVGSTCTADWRCDTAFASVWNISQPVPNPITPVQPTLERKIHFVRNPSTGDVLKIEAMLRRAGTLDRHHSSGGPVATAAPGRIGNAEYITLAMMSYDTFGNVISTERGQFVAGGSPLPCTTATYDGLYSQLPRTVRNHVSGCGSKSLDTTMIFDRGLERVVEMQSPNGELQRTQYDPFGRPKATFAPDPANISSLIQTTGVAYIDKSPVSSIRAERTVDGSGKVLRSFTILNGLGEMAALFQGGSGADWIVTSLLNRDANGRVIESALPWAFGTADPVTVATSSGISKPPGVGAYSYDFDVFGRPSKIRELDTLGSTTVVKSLKYEPLAVESRDAEQTNPASVHNKGFTRIEQDGQGRRASTSVNLGGADAKYITTDVSYAVTGEPLKVRRSAAQQSGAYERTFTYDSLGHVVLNAEPNTGNNIRYAWDGAGRLIGTSDARGCGVNFFYDGLNRPIGEDYSPCAASQPAYSQPDLTTGHGLETIYRYDEYEDGQLVQEPGFIDFKGFAAGNLVSISDRGSHTRFNYDIWGRTRRTARQIAKPDVVGQTGTEYADHWFTSRTDYDLGNFVRRRTTGADVSELLIGGGSEESFEYTGLGQLFSSNSSYGPVIRGMTYEANGSIKSISFADIALTAMVRDYDERGRLQRSHVSRGAPGRWTVPTPGYTLPDSATTQTDLADNRFEYDAVGNPLFVRDVSTSQWPVEAGPVKEKAFSYDDLYRLTSSNSTYTGGSGNAPWQSPFGPEISVRDLRPVPLNAARNRIRNQSFGYDWLGNLSKSTDDASASFDRSLGTNPTFGSLSNGPNQLQTADAVQNQYDASGNLVELRLNRTGSCASGASSNCAQWFAYDWDETGQLARARRWDFGNGALPASTPTTIAPQWDLSYKYTGGARVNKSAKDVAGVTRHTMEVFDTLRIERASFDATTQNYVPRRDNIHVYVGGAGHVFYDSSGHTPHVAPSLITKQLQISDHLGSISFSINAETSELVERTTYQPYGALEADYRPKRWNSFREDYKFTGKEEDIEVGATYFGVRYYHPYLGRYMSADPLTIHGLGSDLNPYGYVAGRPTRAVDPIGLEDEFVWEDRPCSGYPLFGEVVDDKPQSSEDQLARGDAAASQAQTRQGHTVVYHPEAAQLTLENLAVGTAEIPIPGTKSAYFTPSGVRETVVNAGVGMIVSTLDPLGYTNIAKSLGFEVDTRVFNVGDDDTNDKSAIVGGAAVLISGVIIGKATAPKAPLPQIGGGYRQVRAAANAAGLGGQVHHMPAMAATLDAGGVAGLNRGNAPSIWMTTLDHSKTASFGGYASAGTYRAQQQALIQSGAYLDAMKMDVDAIRLAHGARYDGAIQQMGEYVWGMFQ